MNDLKQRLVAAWVRGWMGVAAGDTGLLDLIVNLSCVEKVRSAGFSRIVVLVNGRREALLLRLLQLMAAIPRCSVRVVHRPDDLRGLAEQTADGKTLLLATLQLFLKHHQAVVALRRHASVVVI